MGKIYEGLKLIKLHIQLRIKKIPYGKRLRGTGCSILNKGTIEIGSDAILNKPRLFTYFSSSKIFIGDNCFLNGTEIHARSSVRIGNWCILSSAEILDNNSHNTSSNPYKRRNGDPETKPVVLEENVWVGMESLIMKGVTIGKNSIIGAHSVVTKNVPPNELWAGNPARFIKKLTE